MERIHTRARLSSQLGEEAWFSISSILSVWCDVGVAGHSKGHLTPTEQKNFCHLNASVPNNWWYLKCLKKYT